MTVKPNQSRSDYVPLCDDQPTPQQQAKANAQLAPPEPVEERRRILRPRYGPR